MKLNRAFSIIEILVVVALLTVIGGAILSIQVAFGESQISTWKSYQNTTEVNDIVRKFIKETRSMRIGEDGSYPLSNASDNEIIFYSDIDFDGKAERVRYTRIATLLEKGVIDPQETVPVYPPENENTTTLSIFVRNENTPTFSYWSADDMDNPLASAERISGTKLVKIYLKINIKEDDPSSNVLVESGTNIRMLK